MTTIEKEAEKTHPSHMLVQESEKKKAYQDIFGTAHAFKPPNRITIAEGVAKTLVVEQTGAASSNWSPY